MLIENKKIYIYHKQTMSPYASANKDHLIASPRTLGSAINAVNKMLASGEEMKVLMPEILGVSATSPNWDNRLAYYWNSISEDVDPSGRTLEIGFMYDIDTPEAKAYIESFNKVASDKNRINSDEALLAYFKNSYDKIIEDFKKNLDLANKHSNAKDVEKSTSEAYRIKFDKIIALESQKYKYGKPVNTADYMLYRFCLVHSQVANEYSLVEKSQNIRFYLHSEDEIKQYKEEKIKLEKDRMNAFLEVVKAPDTVENLLYALGLGFTIKDQDAADRNITLNTYSMDNTKKFIQTINNKQLETIGMIEKYIVFGMLRRLDGSTIIVDGVDSGITIGNTIEESVSFFTNKKNEAYLSELNARFKGLPKN
jgi:hypothetical protein